MEQAELVVIGAGVGGYVGAIRAAQLGLKVVLVEREPTLGGTCLNVGCIPSKALLESSELYERVRGAGLAAHGIQLSGEVRLDLPALQRRKEGIVRQLTDGVRQLMKKNRITVVQGQARLDGPGRVVVAGPEGSERVFDAARVLLASGSEPMPLSVLPFDGERVLSSTELLALQSVPAQLLVVGAGAVGLELGSVWRRLGAQVTVVEVLPRLLPFADRQVAMTLQRALVAQGLQLRLQTRLLGGRVDGERVVVTLQPEGGEPTELSCDRVLVAVGRRPRTEGLNLPSVGITLDERGRVPVDAELRTTAPGIWAVGDLVAGPMLAHKASHEAVVVAERMAGRTAGPLRHDTIPNVVYTEPELASVGLSEDEARAAGHTVRVGRALFRANGRALTLDAPEGMVKVIADAATDRLLGVHIVGPRASDLVAEAVVALEFAGSAEDLARIVHAHPTLSEALHEAALDVDRRAIHA